MQSVAPTSESGQADEILVTRILQVGLAGCFIGHGAFGLITKAAWVPYFAVGGVSELWAWRLMPVVGAMDIIVGLVALIRPCRALLAWGVIWCVWTALLRPLSGESAWEALERAGNYGVPLALLVVAGVRGSWFAQPALRGLVRPQRARLMRALQFATATLLVGHAGLGFFAHKTGLAHHYAALGIANPAALVPLVGAFEFFLAGLVLTLPRPEVFVFVCFWKLATESLFLVAGAPIWELIERFGSYTAPLAVAILLLRPSRPARPAETALTTW